MPANLYGVYLLGKAETYSLTNCVVRDTNLNDVLPKTRDVDPARPYGPAASAGIERLCPWGSATRVWNNTQGQPGEDTERTRTHYLLYV